MLLNILYDCSRARVMALGRPSPIHMFNVWNRGIIPTVCIRNGKQGRLLFEGTGGDWKQSEATVYNTLHSKSLSTVTIFRDDIR
jgi:hypothetical protein